METQCSNSNDSDLLLDETQMVEIASQQIDFFAFASTE